MAHLALYRKYRPNGFDKVLGQEHIVKTLVNQIETDRLGHAYLFTGTRGTGKTSLAKIFAKAINCQNPINGSPCGTCATCVALSDPSNIDVVEIDAASNNGVNEIRDLREKVQFPPVSCKLKVYIIDEVHMLSGAAFNALLKTLEEPPKHVVFILATTEAYKIPATILSRCMRFDFRLVSTETIANLIASIYDEQGKEYEKEAIYAIAKAGEGSVRDALSIADTALSYSNKKLTYDDVNEILGASNEQTILELINSLLNSKAGKALQIVEDLCSLGKSIGVLTKDVTNVIRNMLIINTCENANSILALPEQKFNILCSISKSVSEQRLLRILQIYSDIENQLKYSVRPRILFECATVKACEVEADCSFDGILARLSTLEKSIKDGVVVKNEIEEKSETIKREEPIVKVEPSEEAQNENKKEQTNKVSLDSLSVDEIRSKLLLRLKENNSQIVWSIMQNVFVSMSGNILVLQAQNNDDFMLLQQEPIKERILEALNEYSFEIDVKLKSESIKLNEIEDATEKVKKIFGEDIVIIK